MSSDNTQVVNEVELEITEQEDAGGTLVKAVRGGKWMFLNIFVQKFFTFFIFLVLSRQLSPEDFGIMAVVLLVINTIDNLSVVSFERAITQRKDGISRHYLDPAWTFNMLRGIGLYVLIFVAAPWLGLFFQSNAAVPLIRAGALLLFIESISNIGQIMYFRALEFKKVFIRDFIGQIAQLTVSLVWAYVHPSVYALLAGHLARTIAVTASTFYLSDYRPRISFAFRRLRDLVGYSKWVTAQGFSSYLMSIVDNTFVGHLLGPASLAYYSKALSMSSLVSSQLFNVIYRVGFPAYVRVQDQLEKVRVGFLKSLDLAFVMSLPFLLFIWLFGDKLVVILFGTQWVSMVMPLKILTIAATFGAFINITLPVFEGIGKPRIRVELDVLRLVSMVPLLIWFVPLYGMNGASWAVTISFAITLVYTAIKLRSIIAFMWHDIWPAIVTALVPTLLVAGSIYFFQNIILSAHRNPFLGWMVILSLEYGLLMLLTGYLIKRGPYKTVLHIARVLITEYI
jgi:O-antigen/teichoic acid export membrane protein